MSLRTALGWSSIQTIVRIGLGFVSAKVSAIYLGPSGVALVGQLVSFLQLVHGSVGNAAGTAVVSLTAERRTDSSRMNSLWATALRLVWTLALACLLVVGGGSKPIAAWLLGDSHYWPALVLGGLAIVLVVTETVISSALNGLKQVNLIAKTSIGSTLIEVTVYASLVYLYGLWGGLIGTTAIYAVKLVVTCVVAFRSGLVSRTSLFGRFDANTAREILRFYPMLLTHSIALPLAQILVRNSVIDGIGLEAAGYLQSVWRLSDMYVGVMTTALGLFFISHYSGLASDSERGQLLRTTALQLFGLTTIATLGVYLFRDLIITIVLTRDFLPMGEMLPFHLAGDVLKMLDYPLQMALVSQRRTYWYITQAAAGPAIFALLTSLLLPSFGAQAAPMAYAASHLAILIGLSYALRHLLLKRQVLAKDR